MTVMVWLGFWLEVVWLVLMLIAYIIMFLQHDIEWDWLWYPPVIFVSLWYLFLICYLLYQSV